jgi:hypothetical protein
MKAKESEAALGGVRYFAAAKLISQYAYLSQGRRSWFANELNSEQTSQRHQRLPADG